MGIRFLGSLTHRHAVGFPHPTSGKVFQEPESNVFGQFVIVQVGGLLGTGQKLIE